MWPSNIRSATPLPEPARYFPLRNGRYTVTPSLSRLGTDFGNGGIDTRLFQFDEEFSRFRENKLLCRKERFSKYVCEANFAPEVRESVTQLLQERLTAEYSNLFSLATGSDGSSTLDCVLTGETLHFDSHRRLREAFSDSSVVPLYADAVDALCCQFPEDLAVVCRDANTGDDWLAKLHICAPSHWASSEKIGTSWCTTHIPVPGMEKSRSAARSIVSLMVEREPTVRFTWGIERDDRLNHHPETHPTMNAGSWSRDTSNHRIYEPFYLRVERQVIWGLPAVNAAVFTIRVYHTPVSRLRADIAQREALHEALVSMSEESQRYKGLAGHVEEILSYVSGYDSAGGL